MRLSQWARRLGDFLGIEPEVDARPGHEPVEQSSPDDEDRPAPDDEPTTPVPDPEPAPAKRRIKAVQGPASDEELADLRDIVHELQEHVDAERDDT